MSEAIRLQKEGKDINNIKLPVFHYVTILMDTDVGVDANQRFYKTSEMQQNLGLVPALPYADGYEYEERELDSRLMDDWVLAIQAVKQLAGK